MIIPLSTDLRLGRQPVVTWIVIILCIIVYALQFESNVKYELNVQTYCNLINKKKNKSVNDILSQDINGCVYLLQTYHIYSSRGVSTDKIEDDIRGELEEFPEAETEKLIKSLRRHHEKFSSYVSLPLDESIMYAPQSFNPLTMISSSLAHGGFWHLFGNLIFFFAFAPAIELLIGNRWKFTLALLGIAIGGSLAYSFYSISQGTNLPTVGLSGVVMGVIGMAAYLMPRARINTVIWLIIPIMWLRIPAWLMALWYIGFDAWALFTVGMNSYINVVIHVAGGVIGYFICRVFFKKRRDEFKDELDHEIEQMNHERSSALSMNQMASTYKNMRVLEEQHNEDMARKSRMAYEDKLYNMIRTDQSSEAMALILADADPLYLHPDHYTDVFEQVGGWRKHRAYLCIGRLLIDLYSQHRRYADAFRVLKDCLQVTREFVLANPRDVLMLAQEANRQQLYKLAVALLHKVEERYPESAGYIPCGLLEIDILAHHLGKAELAIKRIDQLVKFANETEKNNLQGLKTELSTINQDWQKPLSE